MIAEILSELVAIPSVNPSVVGGGVTDGEGELGEFVRHTLATAGIDVTVQAVHPGRANIIGHLRRSPTTVDQHVVLLSAHMDTYPASEDGSVEYRPKIREGRLYGRGSADAKGSLAAMLHALLGASKAVRRREAYFVASVDEEFGMTGVRKLTSYGVRATLAITGEPTALQPIVAQKGIVRFCVRVRGDSSHAAYPSKRNSILDLGEILQATRHFGEILSASNSDRDLGLPTLSATRLECDGEMNRSPQASRVFFDARFLPGDSAEAILERFNTHLRSSVGPNVDFVIEPPLFVSPSNRCPVETPLVGELFKSIEAVSGRCVPGSFAYGSEAGYLAQMSTASLVLGPGDPKHCHAPGESIELREVEDACRIFQSIIAP
ncbi:MULTISPECIES: M20 family metallopeptidase [unclassified Bradyrhizobium]|uniref:M20 family metallopeptidase n=1 Tax=unclassified Bradyrhizobium TaxID=2631580 RepID=UPI002915D79A|nr:MULTISPECIES: M20/M25/M40 family metallo-hydrolase [unclassified Bradyrhizobium]